MEVTKKFAAGGGLTAFVRAVLALLCLQAALSASPAWAKADLLTLGNDGGPVAMTSSLEFWLDAKDQSPVEKVEAGADSLPFAAVKPGQAHLLDNAALWLRFDAVVESPQIQWKLELPMSGVDKITLYYRNSLGRWVVQQAGDSLPISAWPQPGRYPILSLSHEVGQTVRYYLRVEHARIPFSALPRAVSDAQVTTARQLDHLLLGVYFGLAALVTVLALINAMAYRDWGFATYAFYMATFAGSQAAFSGVAGLYLWPELPKLNNISIVLLPLTAAAAALWFVRTVTTPKRFSRALDWFIVALMGLLPVIALIDAAFPTIESFALINVLISAGMVVLLMVVGVSLFEGDRHARWMAMGFLPIILATLFPLLRNFGVLASSFLTQNALMLGSAVEAPILFYGLLRRVTQRRESATRATTLGTTDPLTGLGSARLMLAKLRQALRTAERYQQPCALLVVNLSNLAELQQQHGRETGDRAMVLAAARIRTAAQTTDTVARVGDSHFALLMEGPMTSDGVNQVATKILASGLRPSRELPDADPLLFHIAIGYMGEPAKLASTQPQSCLDRLMKVVKDMNDGSRKAIRMVYL
ncbi:sensor domain-containing diguanylate cyclase [Polaromonas sp.]|uniref:sensor domain-containing diguanylate cyclase n=1 Tax=Polaromonas sp. TaxID=1869339 RepID=UPI003CA33707